MNIVFWFFATFILIVFIITLLEYKYWIHDNFHWGETIQGFEITTNAIDVLVSVSKANSHTSIDIERTGSRALSLFMAASKSLSSCSVSLSMISITSLRSSSWGQLFTKMSPPIATEYPLQQVSVTVDSLLWILETSCFRWSLVTSLYYIQCYWFLWYRFQ